MSNEERIGMKPRKRLTPEQVAMSESMKTQYNKSSNYTTSRCTPGTHTRPADRTKIQQFMYERNLRYRIKYRIAKTNKRLINLYEQLDRVNSITDPRQYAKIIKYIYKSNEKLEELEMIKERYVINKKKYTKKEKPSTYNSKKETE